MYGATIYVLNLTFKICCKWSIFFRSHIYTKRLVKNVVSMIVGQYMNLMWGGGGGGFSPQGPPHGSDPELTGRVSQGTWRLQSYSSETLK